MVQNLHDDLQSSPAYFGPFSFSRLLVINGLVVYINYILISKENYMVDYIIRYSKRKTVGIYVGEDGNVEVRCPMFTNKTEIDKIIKNKILWIEKARVKILKNKRTELSEKDKEQFTDKAKTVIPEKVSFFSKIMCVKPASVRIGNSRSYWGCCSAKNKLNFSWRLMMAGDNAINYVVVHELAHIKEHNHSDRFWNEVKKIIPDYEKYRKELREIK